MTGVNKTVWESTYEELLQLNITTNITAGYGLITCYKFLTFASFGKHLIRGGFRGKRV